MGRAASQARIAELEAELTALRSECARVVAGESIRRGALLVVDVETLTAYAHGETKTVPDKLKIWGTARRGAKRGRRVSIKHWFCEDDCGVDCRLCAQVNP
jgi:hypothetical protein